MIAVAAAAAEGQAQPAQQATVTGQVTVSGTGQPLGAVQVFIPSLNVGTQTRDDGRFSFAVPARAVGTTVTVTARRLGYRSVSQTVALRAGAVDVNFTVEAAPTQLTGVVVSALSVQREKATIGTSQQQVSGAELIKTRDPNVVNSLSGKVSGVQINAGGAIGGSSRIVIRGNNSINGNNQPLFIVDGTPVSNANVTNSTQAAGNGGIDYGNAIRDLNPDDIASLTVLKGPNAAALYGSRAANGAIVITTKSGRTAGQGVQATANSYTTFETPMRLPSYQNVYGQGSAGQFKFVDGAGGGVQDGNDQSFGPRLDGRLIDQFTGKQQPWVAQPNNVADFFNLGRTFQNNVAISANAAGAAARISVANEQVAGIVPGSRLNKTTASVNGEARFQDRLTTNASVQYVRNQGFNRPGTGYNAGILEQFVWFGRQVDINALRARRYNDDGSLYNWNYNYHNNPYWLMYDNPNRDQRDRVIGSAQAQYKVLPWLTGTLRSGLDTYRENRDQNFAAGNLSAAIGNFAANGGAGVGNGVDPNYAGGFDFYNRRESEYNTEGFLTAAGTRGRFDLNALVGGNLRRNQFTFDNLYTTGLSVAGIYNVSNAAVTPTQYQRTERRGINSAYGQVSATFNKFWTVDVTGRNDWSSTLPTTTNSYFYPSVSSSLVLTDLLPALQRGPLGFMKLRGSIASVGNDADPYQLQSVFLGQANKFGSQPQYTLGNTIANPNLKPERTTSSEGGVEVGLFDNRLTLDATYYSRRTDDQIINLQISNTTGFNAKAINAGRVTNKGVEALLTAIPIRTARGFTWTSTVNFTTNRNKVVTLAPGLSTVVLGTSWSVNVEAREGEQYGAIVGAPFLRDSATGQLLLSARGTPLPDNANRRVLGNFNPDWLGGWNNEFRYKGATLSALIDVRKGGDVFSVTNMFGTYAGVLSSTVNGRENDWNDPGILVPGLARATGQPNTVRASAERYYQSLYGIHEAFVYDAGFVKLREVRLGYDLPRSLLGRARVRSANVAFVGRNLLMRTNVPNIDPESALSTGNVQGLEFATLPTARSIGFNITVTP
jgi:TonB-linked SusC/RagA family outer membrane protein